MFINKLIVSKSIPELIVDQYGNYGNSFLYQSCSESTINLWYFTVYGDNFSKTLIKLDD